jgi:S1-C subfamily serine protease
VPDARSSATLGAEREGTGIVIGDDGLVLTIGYLIIEADQVSLVDQQGRSLPARVVGYDHVTGLGLVRAVVPLDVTPLRFGESSSIAERDPVMIINHAGASDVTLAWVVSKRAFTGNWEYMLDTAIFTSPPALNWSGAALISKDMKLVGVGSLIVREASTVGETVVPGNMFVPIDALKPILSDLVKTGRPAGAARPWLGVSTDEVQGRLVVSRVSPEGPEISRASKSATSFSASAATGVARTRSSIARSGAAARPEPISRCACSRAWMSRSLPFTRSIGSNTSAPGQRTDHE